MKRWLTGIPAIVTKGGASDDFCSEQNSLLINSEIKYFDEKRIGDLETVDFPWIFEPAADDLVEKLKFAFNNKDKMKELGQEALKSVLEKFTWKKAYEKLYERILFLKDEPILRFQADKKGLSEKEKSEFQIYYQTTLFNLNNKNYNSAFESIHIAIESFNGEAQRESEIDFVTLHILAGNISLLVGNIETARKDFEKALNENPGSSQACIGLGETFLAEENYEAAKIMFEWGLKYDSKNKSAEAKLNYVNSKLEPETYEQKKEDNDPFSEVMLSYINKDYDTALNKLAEAEKNYNGNLSNPENYEFASSFYNLKGFNLLGIKDVKNAKLCFEKALNINPESSQACAGLAEIFFINGMKEQSKTMFEWAVKNNPENSFAVEGLKKINTLLRKEETHNTLLTVK